MELAYDSSDEYDPDGDSEHDSGLEQDENETAYRKRKAKELDEFYQSVSKERDTLGTTLNDALAEHVE